MHKPKYPFLLALLLALYIISTKAQTTSASNNLIAQPIPDRTVPFSISDAGVAKPITWGLDLAWLSEDNIRRGVAFMGSDRVDVVRSSFTPTAALVNGDLQTAQLNTLNQRLSIINSRLGSNTQVVLNCDHPSVDASFQGNAANWAQLIDVTTRRHQEAGRTVVTVSPFNEPDYTATGQGTVTDFYNIAGLLKQNSRFSNIRISGGNTLNNDQALTWYNTLKDRLDEGNTHQLAGSFDNYATFHQTVRANGDYATNDELHNVMEAMVGVEYGLQSGIWWGTAELARGEFVKASDGVRLGYAEHRPNWTAASVYRTLEGKVQVFGGTSERQAVGTSYRFVSKDRDVYYDGYGPQREYIMSLPGGTGYQTGQTNAERVVNVTWGDDIQPVINGRYILVNRNSGMVAEVAYGSTTAGTAVQQNINTGATYQQWDVTPVDSRIGGDYSYFTLTAAHSGKAIDVLNFSLENGGSIDAWDNVKNGAQQWYLDYAGDGWFYIRSRHSAKCLDVYNASTSTAAGIVQWDKNGGYNQQWRLIPVGATVEFVAPAAPTNLTATANAESIRLNWTASAATDLAGYTIFRSESAGGPYNTIARNVTTTSFVDNTATTTGIHYYVVKAVDNSLNRSVYSNEVSATSSGSNDIVTSLAFDGTTVDNSVNLNHSAAYGSSSYVTGKVGTNAIALNGTTAFLQLPANVANQQTITIATWVYWKGGSAWQRIFDFGNDQNQYMFLTPNSGSGLRFAIKNGGAEQILNATALPTNVWCHVAVTLSASEAIMYVNGQQVAQSTAITIRPLDFKPILNYIGRSQYADPLLNGNIDDFRIYNYAISSGEVSSLAGIVSGATYLITNVASGKCLDNLGATTNGANVAQWASSTSTNQQWVITLSSGYYKLKCVTGNMYLDGINHTTDGSTVGQWSSSSSTNQQWTITPVGSYFKITNRTNGKCLDTGGGTTDGSTMQFWGSGASTNQLWTLSRIDTGSARIVAVDAEVHSPVTIFYPNPVIDELTIETEGIINLCEIFSSTGEKVYTEKLAGKKNSISLKGLSSGLYFLKVNGNGHNVVEKIVKK